MVPIEKRSSQLAFCAAFTPSLFLERAYVNEETKGILGKRTDVCAWNFPTCVCIHASILYEYELVVHITRLL